MVQAKEVTSPLLSVSEAMALSKEYSPLSTKTQWFPDPSDPFFDKAFPVKDLKDGFVLSRKPLVIIMRPKGHTDISINQYVGGGSQGTFWMTEGVNAKGQLIGIGPVLGSAPNGLANYLHPYKALGDTVNAVAVPSMTWAAGFGKDVVPLPKWNHISVLCTIQRYREKFQTHICRQLWKYQSHFLVLLRSLMVEDSK